LKTFLVGANELMWFPLRLPIIKGNLHCMGVSK
jgi:hypothetical protein